jgi:hypothetical protein
VTLEDTRPAAVVEGQDVNAAVLGPIPPRYTPGVHLQICDNIRAGNRPVTAANMAGITSQNFYMWMQLGRAGNPHLVQFVEDIEIATGQAEGSAVKVIQESFWENPDNAKWWLERTRSAGFSKEVNEKVSGLLNEFMDRLQIGLPPDIYDKVLAVASGAGLPEQSGRGHFQLAAKDDGDSET